MEINKFTEKLNKVEGSIYVAEEEVHPENGVYEAELWHDNVNTDTLSIHTGPKLTGKRIETFALSTPALTPWKRSIRIYSTEPVLYISYETEGDMVEAEDINRLQDALVITQEALNQESGRAVEEEEELEQQLDRERERARQSENALEEALGYETARAQNRENTLESVIKSETARAEYEEAQLRDQKADKEYVDKELEGKVDKVEGKGLSRNDFTDALLTKLNGIAPGAQVNTITGVKGDKESTYRTGNVNLLPEDIGALAVTGGTIESDEEKLQLNGTGIFGNGNQILTEFSRIDSQNVYADSVYINNQDSDLRYVKYIVEDNINLGEHKIIGHNGEIDFTDSAFELGERDVNGNWGSKINFMGGKAHMEGNEAEITSSAAYLRLTDDEFILSKTDGTSPTCIATTGDTLNVHSSQNAEIISGKNLRFQSSAGTSIYANGGNFEISCPANHVRITTGEKIALAAGSDIRLVPGWDGKESPSSAKPGESCYIKAGDIQGIALADAGGRKPEITNFSRIRAETFEAGKAIRMGDRLSGEVVGPGSIAGYECTAEKTGSSAFGEATHASAWGAFAEGLQTSASGDMAHAEGYETTAAGWYSHAEGSHTQAGGQCSHAEGYETKADNYASHAGGKYSKEMISGGAGNNQTGDVFVIGNGTGPNALSNALRVTYGGNIYGTRAFQSSGADYAEFIKPWHDGNENNEDRVGYFVTVKNGCLYKADRGDYIAGITSGNPSVVGNADEDYYWRYERDEFNRIVMEDVPEIVQKRDEEGNPLFEEGTHDPVMVQTGNIIRNARMKFAENYDPEKQENYVERKDRKEWDYVGMVGVLPVRDDGTCIAGRYCQCGRNGIATLAPERGFDTYMVIERVNDHVVSVIL